MANVNIQIISHNDKPTIWYNTLVGEVLTVEYPFNYYGDPRDRIAIHADELSWEAKRKADFGGVDVTGRTTVYLFIEDFVIVKDKSELETVLEQLDKEVNDLH